MRAAVLCFSAQFVTMFAVITNVHNTVAARPIAVAAVQGLIGFAWVVNVNAVASGNWWTRGAYIAGGMLGASLGTHLAARWRRGR